jgi:hypothetical protein
MSLGKIFSRAETIGGLEINNDALRFSLLKKGRSGLEAEILVEEKLTGKEQSFESPEFAAKLIKFAKKNKIEYVILSVPSDGIFVKTYAFPVSMSDEKIIDSMGLTVDLQLPKKKDEIYCDWMKISEDKINKNFLLAYILKTKADALLAATKKAGLKVVAIESRALSLSRILTQKKDEATLAVETAGSHLIFSVILNNNLIFSISAAQTKSDKDAEKEIKKIINYHEWLDIKITELLFLDGSSGSKTKKTALKLNSGQTKSVINKAPKDQKWLISLGAATRGLIPRRDDEIISLMEIGTESAYAHEKANATANFFIGLNFALAIFFAIAFFVVWSLLINIQNNYTKQISAFNVSPASENTNSIQEQAAVFNNLMDQTSSVIKKEALWSKIVNEIKTRTVSGIIINNLSLPSAEGTLSVTGVAANREAINNLKTSFETSALLGNVVLPLDNLGKKVDIPFSMTFTIKDKTLIYNQ